MRPNEPTTPFGALPPDEGLTEHRPAGPSPAARAFAPGTLLAGRYRITSLLGRGGMGEVYRADDLRLVQAVALKFVAADGARSREELYHEVRVARQVSHPNVCRVHDVVEADGFTFIAMEYVDGEDLSSLLRRIGRLPPLKATEVARDIAAGLTAAHDRGIIHRDLKPANVMIDGKGHARVTDFGLASLAGDHDGRVAGTPPYMAPEQIAGLPATPRTDVYAFGLLLHELFTGERVYGASSLADRRARPAARPSNVSDSVKDADPSIDGVIAACLQEDPEARPSSARAVLAMLPGGDAIDVALAAGETPSPEMVAAAAETGELSIRAVAVALAVILAGMAMVAWQSGRYAFTWMRKPPEVMAERAAEITALAGEGTAARDAVYWYTYDAALRRSRARDLPSSSIGELRPGLMRFVMRQSPQRMAPRGTVQTGNSVYIFQSGRVTDDDPPLNLPGSTMVTLDQNRALVEYRALPAGGSAGMDWTPLLAATGVDMTTLRPASPAATPPVASDARLAWTASFKGQQGRVSIDSASLNGKPAWLRVAGPWGAGERAAVWLPVPAGIAFFQLVLMIASTVIAVVITRRSLRRGRADRTGALRLALYLGAVLFAAWMIAAHHAADPDAEAQMFSSGVGEASARALIVWIFYIALEPGVRRNWPRSLIGWTRLLAGRFRDPMVGREILLGIAGGAIGAQLFWLGAAVVRWRRDAVGPLYIHGSALDPLPVFIGDRLVGHVASIAIAIGSAFLLLMFRQLFGPRGAFVAYGLLGSLFVFTSPAVSAFILFEAFVLLRFGLLTAAATGATADLLLNSPLTLDTSAWFWPRAAIVLVLIGAAAVWAARVARSGART